jgi:hypothetical protein
MLFTVLTVASRAHRKRTAMDREHFDPLTRTLAGNSNRRRIGRLLVTLSLAAAPGWTPLGVIESDAKNSRAMKRKRRQKRKRKRQEQSLCVPVCAGKTCGPNGCGGECGSCGPTEICNSAGTCAPLCIPNCTDRICGPDGCGGSCGTCSPGFFCVELISGGTGCADVSPGP